MRQTCEPHIFHALIPVRTVRTVNINTFFIFVGYALMLIHLRADELRLRFIGWGWVDDGRQIRHCAWR